MERLNTAQKRILEDFREKTIAFFGLGVSNVAAIKFFLESKIPCRLVGCDTKNHPIAKDVEEYLQNNGVELRFGLFSFENIGCNVVFRTPGMNFFSEVFSDLRKKNIPVTSEMELFFDLCPCKIIGITGSDGKTTVTTIISEILKDAGKTVHVGGNIGKPLLPEIFDINKKDFVVIELSSFQLISMNKSPDISVITNISPNHLDIHKNMQEYVSAKKNIFLHQNAFGKAILNYEDETVQGFASKTRGKIENFSDKNEVYNGVCVENNNIVLFKNGVLAKKFFDKKIIKLKGEHNLQNYLAAIAATYEDVSVQNIANIAKNFAGVEHRIEFVRTVNGVSYYNDSIASSPTRTIKGALSVFPQKIILIAGGYDKNLPFDYLGNYINQKVKILILLGATAEKIKFSVINSKSYNEKDIQIFIAENMEDAVKLAHLNAKDKDIVLLSPACASFDLYKNFEERGEHFKSIVNTLY